MSYVVKMPKLGLEMERGTVLEWHVEEGDAVEEGDVLVEVESEKSIGEVEAREDGVLRLLHLDEGETVPPGAPIGIVAGADENIADLETEFETADGESEASTETRPEGTIDSSSESVTEESDAVGTPSQSTTDAKTSQSTADTKASQSTTDVKASPKAKRRADELGVDLTTVEGSGPQGAITADDVAAASNGTGGESKEAEVADAESVDEGATDAESAETEAPRTETPGGELHPQVKELLHELSSAGVPPLYRLSVEEARQTYADLTVPEGEPESVRQVVDVEVPGPKGPIPVRLYEPTGDEGATGGPYPVLVFFHGGGWLVGDLSTHDLTCRALANATGCAVASVAYRRAPENPFPAALEDCYAATAWVANDPEFEGFRVDSGRVAVGGDSAGGTLATGVALVARDREGPDLVYQLLVYPVTNYAFDTDSYVENASGYFITRNDMERFWDAYLETPADGSHPYSSPLRASNLADLPPTAVLTAGFDPLCDEGRAYADRLEAAGVPVTRFEYGDMIHGFLTMLDDPELERARDAIDDLSGELRTAFEG